MENEEPEIKSKQASKRDRTLSENFLQRSDAHRESNKNTLFN